MAEGEHRVAHLILQDACQQYPDDPYLWNTLGLLYLDIGKRQAAATAFASTNGAMKRLVEGGKATPELAEYVRQFSRYAAEYPRRVVGCCALLMGNTPRRSSASTTPSQTCLQCLLRSTTSASVQCVECSDTHRMMNNCQRALDCLEGFLKSDSNRSLNHVILLNLRALYESYAADAVQKKDVLRVILVAYP
jgi:hypothetical protein